MANNFQRAYDVLIKPGLEKKFVDFLQPSVAAFFRQRTECV